MFLCSIALYSIGPCFYHQSHPQLGVVFALAPSLHSFWSYFSTDLQQHIGHLPTWGVHLSMSYLFASLYCSGGCKARILKWFAIPFSSEPHSVRPLHHDPSVLAGPTRHGLVSLSQTRLWSCDQSQFSVNVVSVCLPSNALSQCLPSYLGFSYLVHGVSLHGCSRKAQLQLITLDVGQLLLATGPDLGRGVAPLGCSHAGQPPLLHIHVPLYTENVFSC